MKRQLDKVWQNISFSGAVVVEEKDGIAVEAAYGHADRSNGRENEMSTRFGIASGCKIFTAVAICQLVEAGKISFDTRLKDCLEVYFPHFDENITIHHLLTHTSGVPDYFDEEEMDDFEALWVEVPMYTLRSPGDFLPLFRNREMKFQTGARFHYNNAGYILLGLVIEVVSGRAFDEYIVENVFRAAGMGGSGYFEFDRLPEDAALGYIDLEAGGWKTNIYSLPVKGGADGGAYVTVHDMIRFWKALLDHRLMGEEMVNRMLTPYSQEDDESWYGYGVWIEKTKEQVRKYHVMGYDPGVSFHSAWYPESGRMLAICSNESAGAYDMMEVIEGS